MYINVCKRIHWFQPLAQHTHNTLTEDGVSSGSRGQKSEPGTAATITGGGVKIKRGGRDKVGPNS